MRFSKWRFFSWISFPLSILLVPIFRSLFGDICSSRYTGSKFVSGTGGKFTACVLVALLAILLPVSLILVVYLGLRISPWIFETFLNDPTVTIVIYRGLGEDVMKLPIVLGGRQVFLFTQTLIWIVYMRGLQLVLCRDRLCALPGF